MITHVITDQMFPEIGIKSFRSMSEEQNRSLIISDNNDFIYLKEFPDIVIKNKSIWFFNPSFISSIRTSDALVFHSLTLYGIIACIYARRKTKILWIGWGYDYYNRLIEKGYVLFGPLTAKLKSWNDDLDHMSCMRKLKKLVAEWLFNCSLRRINYFSPVIMEDFNIFAEYFPESKMKYLSWNYGDSLSAKSLKVAFPSLGPNILVGNSASFTSNHLEVFEILKQIELGERKIIVPLSYGSSEYRNYILRVGKEIFADAFVPLLDFMSIENYHEILKSCSIAIMNHYRQQAVGNISALIQSGAKVYLSDRNPFLKTCKRIGVKVFLVEDLERDSSSFYHPLTETEKETNYSCFIAEFNQEKIHHQTKIIIDNLLSKS